MPETNDRECDMEEKQGEKQGRKHGVPTILVEYLKRLLTASTMAEHVQPIAIADESDRRWAPELLIWGAWCRPQWGRHRTLPVFPSRTGNKRVIRHCPCSRHS